MHLSCCIHYYIDVLPVNLGGISGDIEDRDDVSCWLCCVEINWFILVLILLTSLVVAVPINKLSVSLGRVEDFFSYTC